MGKDEKFKCPIPDTHNRLNQAFSLFQNILKDYQDPLRFTSALNNLIQNLRNVTFVLQKELARVDGFSKWYSKKQDEMKRDDILKWLVDARNYVVKQGDLKKKSFAKVCLKNHYDQDIFSMELDPAFSTREIASDFCKQVPLKIQKNLLEQTIIEVEKIWKIDKFPEAEIIDILIYCLGVITDLVYKCHDELLNKNALLCEHNLYIKPLENFMVVLHNTIKRGRVTRINYKTGEIYGDISEVILCPDKKAMEEAKERYGNEKPFSSLVNTSDKDMPFNNIQYHLDTAKHLFSIDGFLVPMAFLYFHDRPPMLVTLGLDDPATKYLVFEKLAETIDETDCEAFIIVSEVWTGDMPKKGEEYVPAYIQQKKEFMLLQAVTPNRAEEYMIEIIRDRDGKPSLKKEEKIKNGTTNFCLDRIYKNWELKNKYKKDIS